MFQQLIFNLRSEHNFVHNKKTQYSNMWTLDNVGILIDKHSWM
jgi:hypothetical protein